MKSLTIAPYTSAQVLNAIRGVTGIRQWDFRFDLLSSTGTFIKTLTNVKRDGNNAVTHDSTAEIKRTATFSIVEDGTINYLSNRIKPYVRLRMDAANWVEWPMGVFLLTTPKKGADLAGVVTRDIECYDQTIVLQSDKLAARYFVGAAAKYTDAISELLLNATGLSGYSVTTNAATLPVAKEWDPGTTRYQIIKDLTDAIGYNSIWFNSSGVAQVTPWADPYGRASEFDYYTDSTSLILPGASQTLDLFGMPNSWVFFVSNPDRAALRVTRANTSATSPTSSHVSQRNQIITEVVQVDDAVDLTVLGAIADQYVLNETMVFEQIDFSTGLAPQHEHLDMYNFNHTDLTVSGKYVEIGWSMPLVVGGSMTHTAQKAIQLT